MGSLGGGVLARGRDWRSDHPELSPEGEFFVFTFHDAEDMFVILEERFFDSAEWWPHFITEEPKRRLFVRQRGVGLELTRAD